MHLMPSTILAMAIATTAHAAVAMAQETAPVPSPEAGRVTCSIDEECLSALHGIVDRAGPNLTLRLTDGPDKVLVDDDGGCAAGEPDKCVGYQFSAYVPASGVFLVDVRRPGAVSVLVVDTGDGRSFELPGQPAFSPSGQRIASTDDRAGRAYDVALWSRYQGHWIDQFRYGDPTGVAWGSPRWSGDDLVTFPLTGADGSALGDARLTWDGQGWRYGAP